MERLIFIFVLLISQISFGQVLHDFSLSSCSERSYPEYIRSRIVRKDLENDTLTLRIGLILNCCIDPEHTLSFRNDSLFVQIDNVSDVLCMCECCFEIEMTFTEFEDDNFQVIYKKPELDIDHHGFETIYVEYPLELSNRKYAFPNPDELLSYIEYEGDTNQFAEDSLKIGIWKISRDSKTFISFHSLNQQGESLREWGAIFDSDGRLTYISGNNGLGESSSAYRTEYLRLFEIDDLEDF